MLDRIAKRIARARLTVGLFLVELGRLVASAKVDPVDETGFVDGRVTAADPVGPPSPLVVIGEEARRMLADGQRKVRPSRARQENAPPLVGSARWRLEEMNRKAGG
jgi:hypothetical protein